MRIPQKLLEHRVVVRAVLEVPSSVGAKHEAGVTRRAITIDKRSKVRDQRAGSATFGEEIVSSSHVLVQPEHLVQPGSLVTVWPGETFEREAEVVAIAKGKHSIAPSSGQMWLT